MRVEVEVKVTVPGIHRWPEAPDRVKFLREPHRHVFVIRARKRVSNLNREIEFLMFQDEILSWFGIVHSADVAFDFQTDSCEMLATKLVNDLELTECGVWEDDENGAIVYAEGR